MPNPVLILIDLTHFRTAPNLLRLLDRHCELHVSYAENNVSELIAKVLPNALCFVYDYMEVNSLNLLKQTKKPYISLPVLMVTEQHSEVLAVSTSSVGLVTDSSCQQSPNCTPVTAFHTPGCSVHSHESWCEYFTKVAPNNSLINTHHPRRMSSNDRTTAVIEFMRFVGK